MLQQPIIVNSFPSIIIGCLFIITFKRGGKSANSYDRQANRFD